MSTKTVLIGIVVTAAIFIVAVVLAAPPAGNSSNSMLKGMTATIYKSPTCGCCGNYAAYLSGYGVDVKIVNTNNLDPIKRERNVPGDLYSCHTTEIGGYISEGHIPVEVIEKMIKEKRTDMMGIAMAGMPVGSPGMPGAKTAPFEIYEFTPDSQYREYMSL